MEGDPRGNGYAELLEKLQGDGGVIADGDKIAKEGIGLIQPPEVKHTNAALIASVPNAQQLYEKKDKDKGILIDLMARTIFRSDEEQYVFDEWVEWCEDFGVGLDGPIRFCVGRTSVGGLSRNQYVEVVTYRSNNSGTPWRNDGGDKNQFRPKYKDGELS